MRQGIPRHRDVFPKLRISLALAVVVLAAALIAYIGVTRWRAAQTAASATATAAAQPQPTSVHVVQIRGNESTFQIVPLDRTITDTNQAQHLYQTILNLPVSCGCGACMPDPEAYVLTFCLNNRVILTVQAHTGMCWDVDLDRGSPNDTRDFLRRQATSTFWAELAQVLGVPQSDVEPLP
jgi:hypothetical protein